MPSFVTIFGNPSLPIELFPKDKHLLAFVSYGNDSDALAEKVQHKLGKSVTATGELLYSSDPRVAVKLYRVDGERQPLLISYIPEEGRAFQRRLTELHGKNEQIYFLQQVLGITRLADEKTHYTYYDLESSYVHQAKALKNVNAVHFSDTRFFSPLEMARVMLRATGLIHPPTLSRDDAAALANRTKAAVLRESTSSLGLIVATRPEKFCPDPALCHYDLTPNILDELQRKPTRFNTLEGASAFLLWRLGHPVFYPSLSVAEPIADKYSETDTHASAERYSQIRAERNRIQAIDRVSGSDYSSLERTQMETALIHAENMLKKLGWVGLSLTPLQATQLANRKDRIVLYESKFTFGIVATYPSIRSTDDSDLTERILLALKRDPESFSTPEKATEALKRLLSSETPAHHQFSADAASDTPPPATPSCAAAASGAGDGAEVSPHGLHGNRATEEGLASRGHPPHGLFRAAASGAGGGAGVSPHGLHGNRATTTSAADATLNRAYIMHAAKEMLRRTGLVYAAGSLSRDDALKLANRTHSVVLRGSQSRSGVIVATLPEASLPKGNVPHWDLTTTISEKCASDPGFFSNPDKALAFLKEIYWGEGVTLHNPSSESRTDETPGGLSPSS